MVYGPNRILIVDNDPAFVTRLGSLLLREGLDVESTNSVGAAVKRLKDAEFDGVILDEDLPDMKGHDAVSILKALRPDAAIIMTASHNTRTLESRVRMEDVFFYHVKCFDIEDLLAAVRSALKAPRRLSHGVLRRRAKILIVDDDREFAEAIQILLSSHGYETVVAHNRDEAVAKLRSASPDLVILDIMLENWSDGFTICKKLKYDNSLREVGVIVVSSVSRRTGLAFPTRSRGEEHGADCYLDKPVEPDELLRRVEQVLDRTIGG